MIQCPIHAVTKYIHSSRQYQLVMKWSKYRPIHTTDILPIESCWLTIVILVSGNLTYALKTPHLLSFTAVIQLNFIFPSCAKKFIPKIMTFIFILDTTIVVKNVRIGLLLNSLSCCCCFILFFKSPVPFSCICSDGHLLNFAMINLLLLWSH